MYIFWTKFHLIFVRIDFSPADTGNKGGKAGNKGEYGLTLAGNGRKTRKTRGVLGMPGKKRGSDTAIVWCSTTSEKIGQMAAIFREILRGFRGRRGGDFCSVFVTLCFTGNTRTLYFQSKSIIFFALLYERCVSLFLSSRFWCVYVEYIQFKISLL